MKNIQLKKVNSQDIETMSLQIIDSEVPEPKPFTGMQWDVVRRMIHTTADFELLDLVRFSPNAIENGVQALMNKADIVTDTQMARCGIPMRRMQPLGCKVHCFMDDYEVVTMAKQNKTTRALAAIDVALKRISPQIFLIGNAPTALMRLLFSLEKMPTLPSLIIGMPVGFVNAEESKALLMKRKDIEFICVKGRKGGSALAASVVNSLANEALKRRNISFEEKK